MTPIDARNKMTGKPLGISYSVAGLSGRQKQLLVKLSTYGSELVVPKRRVTMRDLAALTASEQVEFALFTRKNERLIIRGGNMTVPIQPADAKRLAADGWRWSGHTHPGYGHLVLAPSIGDKAVLACFSQKYSLIFNSGGRFLIFDLDGEVIL